MSHSEGLVKFNDGAIWHFEYNGTVDMCISHIYDTHEEMDSNWRKSKWMNCNCGRSERVEIYHSYGGGHMLIGHACRNCKSLSEDEEDCYGDPIPEWVTEYYAGRP